MRTLISNARIVTPEEVLTGICVFSDGTIEYVGADLSEANRASGIDNIIDARGGYVLPGFIDIHCHGGRNFDFMDATAEQMKVIADFHLSHGTTTMFATTLAGEEKETEQSLKEFGKYLKANPDGTLKGIHLEGPWLNPLQCGAQDVKYMRNPDPNELIRLKNLYPYIARVSAAPELIGGLEFGLTGDSLGIVMSAAHTDADFDGIIDAYNNGYRMLTHFYSGMKGVTRKNSFRIAGAVEAGYYLDGMDVEIIADGRHLPKSLLKLIYKIKGADKICLITDAVRAAGLPDGSESVIGSLKNGMPIIVEDQVAKLPDRQSFAGSTATADRLYRTMAEAIGKDLPALSRMSSLTPARVMGLKDRGSIEIGKRADILIMDEDLEIQKIILKGEVIK